MDYFGLVKDWMGMSVLPNHKQLMALGSTALMDQPGTSHAELEHENETRDLVHEIVKTATKNSEEVKKCEHGYHSIKVAYPSFGVVIPMMFEKILCIGEC